MGRINITAIRRRQIIDATISVMARKGWNDTSIDEITREAGVSRGLVSYHFRDKSELLSGVLARCQEAFDEAVGNGVAQGHDVLERLRIIIRLAVDRVKSDPVNYEVFLHFSASARSDPELGEQIRKLWAGYRAATASAIRYGQLKGLIRTDIDPDAAAAMEISTLIGLALQWLLDPDAYPLEEAARETEEMFMSYITAGVEGASPAAGTPASAPAAPSIA
ncbi:MAG: TetR family transcriptional regulator C-terminal domain-containing protein [Dehalococcoidia bacterium]|nr:TetR/AcrR family transcriptional regulator [Dehalococcoidia bacterium]MCL4230245.1 TetR family transcriptional regulator C-terminal domain-containing protein [Dehalococcoidia bacterium]NUQ56035.1 TetR family transcriptional regulator C-terminal domain-containing protein [Dehalococcoidia bacterium]